MYNREVRNYLRNYILPWGGGGRRQPNAQNLPLGCSASRGSGAGWWSLTISLSLFQELPVLLKGNAFNTAKVLYL